LGVYGAGELVEFLWDGDRCCRVRWKRVSNPPVEMARPQPTCQRMMYTRHCSPYRYYRSENTDKKMSKVLFEILF
jgi:hypothetical protein